MPYPKWSKRLCSSLAVTTEIAALIASTVLRRVRRPESLLGIVSEANLAFDQQLHGMEDGSSLQFAEQPSSRMRYSR
jgi:hypothetical protein